MEKEEFFYKGCDGMLIHAYCWNAVSDVRAVVQISHGMAEHAARYEGFAQWLNGRGYMVYASDHRGHGKTAGLPEDVGYLGEDGFDRIVKDTNLLTSHIKEKHPGLPVFLLAHSFGSFIAQDYIPDYGSEIAGVILSGSSMNGRLEVGAGLLLAWAMGLFGEKRPNKLLDRLMFGRFNSRVENPQSKFDWLSKDEKEVAKYTADPFCGGIFTTNFFYHFFKGMSGLYTREKVLRTPKSLPICILSGDSDPVGKFGRGVNRLYKYYSGLGIEDLTLKLFEGGRHEMLNETNRGEVYEYIAAWLDSHI